MGLRKTQKLRNLLKENAPLLAAGVYDGLSASVAERAGFKVLWASGFCISASKGIPDVGLMTMTEHLNSTTEINVSSDLPVIADVDDGFGDAVNVVHMIRKYESAGIAAICMEDNRHPKRNSLFANLKGRNLTEMEEFAAKIRAAKNNIQDEDFVIIARTEALIANMGLDEALKRAHCYADAGADMILIHSKSKTPDDIFTFGKLWDRDIPLVAVPTMYSSVHADDLYERGYKLIIFANHAMRAAVSAMDQVFQKMILNKSLDGLDEEVAPLSDVFSLVNYEEVNLISSQYIEAGMETESILVDKILMKNQAIDDSKTAIIYGDSELSYAKLKKYIKVLSGKLKNSGIKRGDRVALVMPNCPEFIVAFMAIAEAGGIVVPLDSNVPKERLRFIVKDTGLSLCLCKTDVELESETHIPFYKIKIDESGMSASPEFPNRPSKSVEKVTENSDVLILYSAGSTGRPKGAILKHRHLCRIANTLSGVIGMNKDHRDLILTPLTHSGGWQRVTSTLLSGGTLVISNSMFSVQGIVALLAKYNITGFFTTPPFVRAFLQAPEDKFKDVPSSFKSIEIASAPVSEQELRALRGVFPGINVFLQYGLTECSRAIILDTEKYPDKLHTVGKPTNTVEVKICDEEGNELPQGEEGEICLRAEQRTESYWNLPDTNRTKFRDGWLLTGDYGTVDKDGFVTYSGRRDDMINCGGFSYFPAEVEFMLGKIEGVDSYLIAGVPDPDKTMNDVPWAFVVPHRPEEWEPRSFIKYARAKLPGHMVPRNVIIMPELPMTHSKKPSRRKAIELYVEGKNE